jgi:hypothetical protein
MSVQEKPRNKIKQRKIEGIHRLAQAYLKARKDGTIKIITVPPLAIKPE